MLFRYTDAEGKLDPNRTSTARPIIAGILNEKRNVLGLMPHPENHVEPRSAPPTGAACSTAWSHICAGGMTA